jgi:hypothetical protein
MKPEKASFPTGFMFIVLLLCFILPLPLYGAFYYKSYIVRYDQGWDILCDQYVVNKNDWVIKLFKEKGEIAHQDFPEFLRIFKRINPHIRDIDLIRPGQHILIPLKKIRGSTLPGQSSGIVTIPFVTISSIPEALKAYSAAYETRKGDCVSRLISRKFGAYGTDSYKEGVKLFRLLNPEVKDIDLIYTDQRIRIPEPAMRNQPWYQSVLEGSGDVAASSAGRSSIQPDSSAPASLAAEDANEQPKPPLVEAASALDAKLLNKGVYYLPQPDGEDVKLDLTATPLIELKDGTRFLILINGGIQESELNRIKAVWKNLKVIPVQPESSTEQLFDSLFVPIEKEESKRRIAFSDDGVEVEIDARWIFKQPFSGAGSSRSVCVTLIGDPDERTPGSIVRYLDQNGIIVKDVLKDGGANEKKSQARRNKNTSTDAVFTNPLNRKAFVSDIITAIGYRFAPDVMISFPYAGVQVEAVSNLISTGDGRPLLVDFGDLYGDAIAAIEKTGFQVVQITTGDTVHAITKKLLEAIGVEYTRNPTFFAAKRPVEHNTSITIQGYLIEQPETSKILLTDAVLKNEVVQFLSDRGVKTVMSRFP